MTLADRLAEWRDWDGAAFELGVVLGLFEEGDWLKNKGIVWSANPVGDVLHEILLTLTRAGLLERREEPDVAFRGYPLVGREGGDLRQSSRMSPDGLSSVAIVDREFCSVSGL